MLYFIRHLPTDWTEKGLILSTTDLNINKNQDLELILNFKNKIKHIKNPLVFTSPLIRTQSTAQYLGYKNFEILNEVTEYDLSNYDGTDGKTFRLLSKLEYEVESFSSVKKRFFSVFRFLKYLETECFIFTHGMFMRSILHICKNEKEILPSQLMSKYSFAPLSILNINSKMEYKVL